MLGLLFTAFMLLQTVISRSPDEPIYLVTVTSQTVGGSTETLCAQIHYGTSLLRESFMFTVTLAMEGATQTTLLSEAITTEFYRCVQFQVPQVNVDTVATICATIQGKIALKKETYILIRPSSSLTIIRTDKPIYKPGQTVKFRIVSLDSDFLIYKEVYQTVELQDPDSNRIAQWLNQTTTRGILDLSHQTTPEAKQGVYLITTWNKKGQKDTHTFEIKEYVLPKFEVNVHLPGVISILDTEAKVKVCGKYTYGKSVLGSVTAKVCSRPTFWGPPPDHPGTCMVYILRTDRSGCATQTIYMKDFNLSSLKNGGNFNVESEIEEDGTGVSSKGSGVVRYTTSIYSVEFQDVSPTFRQGINFMGKIIMKSADSSPAVNKFVFLLMCYGPITKNWTLTTDSEGVAHFSLSTTAVDTKYFQLKARSYEEGTPGESIQEPHFEFGKSSLLNAHRLVPQPNYNTAYHSANAFDSKSKSFLQIEQAKGPFPCDKDGQVLVHYTIPGEQLMGMQSQTFSYQVLSKGSIVQYDQYRVTLMDGEVKTGIMSFYLRHIEDLAPFAQVVVYTMLPSGEIVADSNDFLIQLCFKNKVSLQFSSLQELPGEKTFLKVKAHPGSWCSLRAVDQSVLLMKSEQEFSAKTVYDKLPTQRLFGYPYAIQKLEQQPLCIPMLRNPESEQPSPMQRRKRSVYFQIRNDVYSVFKDIGIQTLTNTNLREPISCTEGILGGGLHLLQQPSVPMNMPLSKENIRTFFPETWFWDLVSIGDLGEETVERTVPDTITKWVVTGFCTSSVGFGLASNSSLTAFKPFFVSLKLPYSVIRDEVFQLKATVFNYLPKCIMVQVKLGESAHFTAQPCHGCQYTQCICGEESMTFSWFLTPTSLGEVNIRVSAEAVRTSTRCQNEVVTVPKRGQKDTVVRKLLVKPEGTELTFSHNALLCPQEGAVEKVIYLKLPNFYVKDSAMASISILGDLMGRALKNLEDLLAMPYGCGEQNMLLFAPNIFILSYLETTGQLTQEIKSKAITFLKSGYQRELNYKHKDGSYSAFGMKDPSGHTWLTAFVMKSFQGARPYIFIDPQHITSAKVWLSHQQKEDGCIQSVGKLFHNGMKGGVNDDVMLTAYVTAAVLELGSNSTEPMVKKGLSCLKLALNDSKISTYATALFFYTFTLAKDKDTRTLLIGRLDKMAKTAGHGRHWERAGASGIDSLEVEMASYVLLALLSGPLLLGYDLGYSSTIVHWLVQQQNPYGGFSSTQDTVVALQALTLYAAATFSKGGTTTVTAISTGGYIKHFHVDQSNRLLYQEEPLEEVSGFYRIRAEGEACVFVQITLRCNILPLRDDSSFAIFAEAIVDNINAKKTTLTVSVIVSYNGMWEASNMVIIRIELLSGFLLDQSSLLQLKADRTVMRVDEGKGHVDIYLYELKKTEPRRFSLTIVEDIPVGNLKAAVVTIYDYYQKSDKAVSDYRSPVHKVIM